MVTDEERQTLRDLGWTLSNPAYRPDPLDETLYAPVESVREEALVWPPDYC